MSVPQTSRARPRSLHADIDYGAHSAVGALWASADGNRLYSWGGQFQDTPSLDPPPARTFVYDIQKGEWTVVQTQGDDIDSAAEGQPAIVPLLGEGGDNIAYCGFRITRLARLISSSEQCYFR